MTRTLAIFLCFCGVVAVADSYKPEVPELRIKSGRAGAMSADLLAERDGKVVSINSETSLNSQVWAVELFVPKPTDMPETLGAARVVIAMQASRMLDVRVSAWHATAKTWMGLETQGLPLDKNGFLIVNLPQPKVALAGEKVRLQFRVEDHEPAAGPFTITFDAAVVQVAAALDEEISEHQRATAEANDAGPLVRVHDFQGQSSGKYENNVRNIQQSFEKSKARSKAKPKRKRR